MVTTGNYPMRLPLISRSISFAPSGVCGLPIILPLRTPKVSAEIIRASGYFLATIIAFPMDMDFAIASGFKIIPNFLFRVYSRL